jgi:hypothetical protein
MDGKIFNSAGTYVAVLRGESLHDLTGRKLYELKSNRIYRLSGELVGHLERREGSVMRLHKSADGLF